MSNSEGVFDTVERPRHKIEVFQSPKTGGGGGVAPSALVVFPKPPNRRNRLVV